MRLLELSIGSYKNLVGFRTSFDHQSPYTVLVGENGAGKSNVIEAICLVFRNLDLGESAPFDFNLTYECRGRTLSLAARKGSWPVCNEVFATGERRKLSRSEFLREDDEGLPLYRPAFVFGYYSGPTDRLGSAFERHQDRYYRAIITPRDRRRQVRSDPTSLRRLFYTQNLHGQFALMAFFVAGGADAAGDREFLRSHLQIDELESVLFVLTEPRWNRSGGDPSLWNSVGEVQEFAATLRTTAMLPMRLKRRVGDDSSKRSELEHLYLFLPSQEALQSVYARYPSQYAFFAALESLHLSKMLGEVRTRVRMTPAAGRADVTYRDLSEGEKQLLLVLGLLKFTAREETLFLLDEPDTHLNPVWSVQYLQFLDRFIGQRGSCHIVMSSHDPLVFASLARSQVRILHRGADGRVVVDEPAEDPRGMGVQAILASDLFRLRSGGLDIPTYRELERQRLLSTKSELNHEEELELRELSDRLNRLGFWTADLDPNYQLFLRHYLPALESQLGADAISKPELTPAQVEARDQLAAEITRELAESATKSM